MISTNLNFYCIKRHAASGPDSRIVLSISFNANRLVYYPGILVANYQWDKEKQQFMNRPDKDLMNEMLLSVKKQVIEIHRSLSIRYGKVTVRHFRDELTRVRVQQGRTLTDAFLQFMEESHEQWSKNTFLKCRDFYKKLSEFSKYYGSYVSLETVDRDLLESFHSFLKIQGLAESSVYNSFNIFKWFLHWAERKGLIINKDYSNFKLSRVITHDQSSFDEIFLTRDELEKIWNSQPQDRKILQCRDIFCCMAFSGCSLRELYSIMKTDVDKEFIYIRGKKSRKIPLNERSSSIVRLYENKYYQQGTLFPVFTEMTLNLNIRKLMMSLQLNRELVIRRRGKVLEGTLSELVTMKVAQNTFISNALSMNIPESVISEWSGKKRLLSGQRKAGNLSYLERMSVSIIDQSYENSLRPVGNGIS